MIKNRGSLRFIKVICWIGICADALWALGLLVPPVFGVLTGQPDFHPDLQLRLAMGIGAALMAGWTLLLLWTVQAPIERRFVLLLTAFPVVFGLFVVAWVGYLNGNNGNVWILIKTAVLFVALVTSYLLAGRSTKEMIGKIDNI